MCLADGLPRFDDPLPGAVPPRRARRRIQPLTWIVAVALAPVLLYDVWQTVQDVKHRHAAGGYDIAANLGSPAVARPHGLSD
jgi:hypothetical protein